MSILRTTITHSIWSLLQWGPPGGSLSEVLCSLSTQSDRLCKVMIMCKPIITLKIKASINAGSLCQFDFLNRTKFITINSKFLCDKQTLTMHSLVSEWGYTFIFAIAGNGAHLEISRPLESINHSINQSTNRLIDELINQYWPINIDQSINQPIDQPIDWSIDQSINQFTNRSTNQPIDQSFNQLTNRSTDQSILYCITDSN